eukprot:2342281-Prymnesium_polylepis.2
MQQTSMHRCDRVHPSVGWTSARYDSRFPGRTAPPLVMAPSSKDTAKPAVVSRSTSDGCSEMTTLTLSAAPSRASCSWRSARISGSAARSAPSSGPTTRQSPSSLAAPAPRTRSFARSYATAVLVSFPHMRAMRSERRVAERSRPVASRSSWSSSCSSDGPCARTVTPASPRPLGPSAVHGALSLVTEATRA